VPSKGSRIVLVRLEADLLAAVLAEVERINETRREEPHSLSSWIRDCLSERLTKRDRRRPKGTVGTD